MVYRMVLQLDTSQPLLRPSQLTALVHAVYDADEHDEHRWIEWKSSLDLTTACGQAHVAKAVLGLANRQPAAAAQWTGGYGYLLIGVEPGAILGVTPVDPETLVAKIRAAVGDVVHWTPEYVIIDGVQVLIVIVDPPRPGEPIHYLRKHLDHYQSGTIFVRHTGRTDPAGPDDLDMLQARLLERTPSLQVAVTAASPTIERVPDVPAAVERWAKQHRPTLIAARYVPSPRTPTPGAVASPVRAFGPFAPKIEPDERTEEEYTREVEKFLEQAKAALVNRAVWHLYRHTPALLHVEVTNPTDLGYTGVRLIVHIPGDVNGYPRGMINIAQRERPSFPPPPKPLGTPAVTENNTLAWATRRNILQTPTIAGFARGPGIPPGYLNTQPGYRVRDSGSVDIEYDEFELRPGDRRTMEPVPLHVREEAGFNLTATWYATASHVRGRLTGEFTLAVTGSSLDMAILLQDEAD